VRQPVHRNVIRHWTESATLEARLQQSATSRGRMLLSMLLDHLLFTVMFSYSHGASALSIRFLEKRNNHNAMFGLQVPLGENGTSLAHP